jgi:hypothetical protein
MSTAISTVRNTVEEAVVEGVALVKGETEGHTGTELHALRFATGLATAPSALARKGLGLVAHLVVPPGSCAVAHLPGGEQRTYQPGSYIIWDARPGTVLVQWVDMRRQQVPVGPIEGYSADKWRVRLWLSVNVAVADPLLVAAHREPLHTLVAAVRTGALRYIEEHTHAQLTGMEHGEGGMDSPAQAVLERLRADAALAGLEIINVRVLERQGDERQIEAATQATVAAAQIDEELRIAAARQRAKLHELEAAATLAEREHAIRMAATAAAGREQLLQQQSEVQQAALAARLEIVMAEIRAQAAEIARDEQGWQAEQARFQGEWERVQQQLIEVHRTDQQLRLMDGQSGVVRAEGEVALAAEDRRNAHALALAEVQQRLAEQRTAQAQAITERRAQHERTLLDLHLRHEQLVSEQMARLEQWRVERLHVTVEQQRQHDRQLAAIGGTARIAAAAAALPADTTAAAERSEVAEAGLRALQAMAE